MANEGRRRYKVGVNPEYDSTFDRLAVESLILNPSGKAANDIQNFGTLSMLQSKPGIQRLLQEYQGEDKTKRAYLLNRKETPSKLKEAEMRIENIQNKFKDANQKRINSGHYPLEEMPAELKEELLRAEAAHDIVRAEISRLETALENFPSRDNDETMPCLKSGPIGSGKKRGGVLVRLDGQNVAPDPEGVLRIKDSRSPYNGMLAADYFEKIVKPYKQAQVQLSEEYQIAVSEAERSGQDSSNIPKKRPANPPWPKGAKGYDWGIQNT